MGQLCGRCGAGVGQVWEGVSKAGSLRIDKLQSIRIQRNRDAWPSTLSLDFNSTHMSLETIFTRKPDDASTRHLDREFLRISFLLCQNKIS